MRMALPIGGFPSNLYMILTFLTLILLRSDCARPNILMNADKIYPKGFHPQRQNLSTDGRQAAKMRSRATVPHPKYYFINFHLSTRFVDESAPRLTLGRSGTDRTIPELSDTTSYDPFTLDVYVLGNVLHRYLLSVSPIHLKSFHFSTIYSNERPTLTEIRRALIFGCTREPDDITRACQTTQCLAGTCAVSNLP